MPKRSFNPKAPGSLVHHVFRPLPRRLGVIEGVSHSTPRFKYHNKPSPHLTGDRWRAMRQAVGGSGHNACYKPLVFRKEVLKYSGPPTSNLLELPAEKFLDTHKRPSSTKKADQTMFLEPSKRLQSVEEYDRQPVLARHPSYTDHHTSPPTRQRARGFVKQKNSFIQRARAI
eukprot:TRINITY_DN2221_c4_g1_i1.p1 TRINITY_DN2221_c4_g1~~TRINITY_DN2221_c4_g1_i1.p1  ORF type:complete len:172 (+),score=18.91 TRINITY_DN2221_c4_g1_i1:50-565(+)